MITDPVSGVNASTRPEWRVTRGACYLNPCVWQRVGGGRPGDAHTSGCGRGLRLSLSLPCNSAGSLLQ